MNIESHAALNRTEVDQVEADLKRRGYRQVSATGKLHPGEYYRNEWSGTSISFDGPRHYYIEWCKRD